MGNKIKTTEDYEQFKFLQSNRPICAPHVTRIKESMQDEQLICPIIVNEKMQIIDGQHRFAACKELKLPVHYIQMPGYGYEEVKKYNLNQKNWGLQNFHEHYMSLGMDAYMMLDYFMAEFNLTLTTARIIATGHCHERVPNKMFKEGAFKFDDYEDARWMAARYNQIKGYWDFSNSRAFVKAFIKIVKSPKLDWKRFTQSLEKHHPKIVRATLPASYMKQMQDVYNYCRNNKVRLYIEEL